MEPPRWEPQPPVDGTFLEIGIWSLNEWPNHHAEIMGLVVYSLHNHTGGRCDPYGTQHFPAPEPYQFMENLHHPYTDSEATK